MNRRHAPNRCDPRATRIAQVKFVTLPMELTADPLAVTPEESGAQFSIETNPLAALFSYLRTHIIRVIGRLEAARP
jgi:hypothetical protein